MGKPSAFRKLLSQRLCEPGFVHPPRGDGESHHPRNLRDHLCLLFRWQFLNHLDGLGSAHDTAKL
jgi:hypothetical protein